MRGLIFDFDGTIALSEPVHMEAWRDLAAEYGFELPEGFLERGIGATDDGLAEELAAHWRGGPDAGTILAKKRRNYQARCATQSVLVPGIETVLAHAHALCPVGIATSASVHDITPTLDAYGLGRYFHAILTVEDVERPKPHPEIYLKAAAKLGIDPRQSYAFEDSPTGAAAARAAGLRVIGMTTTFPPEAIGPVIGGLADYRDLTRVFALLDGLV